MNPSSERGYPRVRIANPLTATAAQGEMILVELGLDSCLVEHASSLWAGRRVSLSVRTSGGELSLADVRVVRSRIVPAPHRAVRYVSELSMEQRYHRNRVLRSLLADLVRPEIETALSDRLTRRAV